MREEERKNFDMMLEECRQAFGTIGNLVIVDDDGKIKYLSPSMYRIIEVIEGKPVVADVIGKHILDVHPPVKFVMR